jgi:hypothetical protein
MKTQKEKLLEHAKCFGYHVQEPDSKEQERLNRNGNESFYVEKQEGERTQGVRVVFEKESGKLLGTGFSSNYEFYSVSGLNFTGTKKYFEGPKLYGKVEWVEGSEPEVGVGTTMSIGSDSFAGTIVEVINEKKIVVRSCKATLVEGWKPEIQAGGFSGHCLNNSSQEYTYEDNLESGGAVYTLRSNGQWHKEGQSMNSPKLKLGIRRHFHDYNF